MRACRRSSSKQAASRRRPTTGGIQLNFVPKDGGNRFSGNFSTSYSGQKLASDNITDEVRARGVTVVNEVRKIWDLGGGFGGPLKRDRLWFFTAHRTWGAQEY